ncbi:SWIM zinc finger family protein [Paenibacillus thiaminolyticus]|uniref:SWIM zinc finger family protein n=1 Tax=Paenibacillus thiaminolyticus TaxID=49283 RepID=UPI00234FE73F|nr:SWIM zinc finger family protein [Paenibacillus thiaminolyticus]WCR25391.1 SWIM zinc finger family protein [Paenibacillus thiaminolyticus]
MSQLGLSVKTFNRVTEQMKRRFRYATLEQGWRYYRKQAVLDMTAEEQAGGGAGPDQWIAAEVYETKRYRVRFNCTAVKRSECTCPEEGGCKHMAAVYFQLCDELGKKPELYLAEFRQVYIEEERQRMVLRKRAEHKAELERRKKAWQMSLSPSAPAQEWHDFFQRKYSKPFTDYHSPVTDIAAWAQNELYREGDRFPKEVVPLYRMHVLLFLLRQLSIRYGQGSSRSYPGRDAPAEETVRPYMEELRRLAESYDLSATPAAYEQHVAALGEIAEAVALSEEESAVDGLDVLALLWSTVLNRPDWMEEAHRRLERMLVPVSSLRPRRRDAIRVALVHLEVLLGREAEAVKRLSELTYHNDPGRYWGYLSEHERSGRYDRIVYWLGALAPPLSGSPARAPIWSDIGNFGSGSTNGCPTRTGWKRSSCPCCLAFTRTCLPFCWSRRGTAIGRKFSCCSGSLQPRSPLANWKRWRGPPRSCCCRCSIRRLNGISRNGRRSITARPRSCFSG